MLYFTCFVSDIARLFSGDSTVPRTFSGVLLTMLLDLGIRLESTGKVENYKHFFRNYYKNDPLQCLVTPKL